MIKSDKRLKALATVLGKENNILISDAIMLLRDEAPFEGAIGLLTSFYDNNNDKTVRNRIEGFMNDLKDKTVRSEVINEIRKQWKPETIRMLVSSCWQSGLDYSEYSIDLVRVFLVGDYLTAIECLTVIEESVHNITGKTKAEIIGLIKESPVAVTIEKRALTGELLSIFSK
jgi:hypothetical protein